MDIARVDLNLLVTLDALLAERNVSRAAVRLGVSQSALSAQLARLRDVFGDPLFVRTARGMLPTARADSLAETLRNVLGEIGRLVEPDAAFDPSVAAPMFKIAASDYVEYALLPVIVDVLEAHVPRTRVALRPTDFRGLARRSARAPCTSSGSSARRAAGIRGSPTGCRSMRSARSTTCSPCHGAARSRGVRTRPWPGSAARAT